MLFTSIKIKRISALLVVSWIIFGAILPLLLPNLPKASAAITTVKEDEKRRKIRAAWQCLSFPGALFIIDEDDDLEAATAENMYSDLFDDEGRAQNLVVGFELESKNAVMTCETAVRSGLIAAGFAGDTDEAHRYFIRQLTGVNYTSGQEIKPNDDAVLRNAKTLGDRLKTELDKIELPNNFLRGIRFAPLVNICFTASSGNKAPTGYDDGNGDFKVDGLGYFIQKNEIDWESFSWITPNQDKPVIRNAKIGSISLGFTFTGTFKEATSDFFPIGSDIGQTNGYTNDSIVDCDSVKKFKDIIFDENTKINGDKAVFVDADGNVIASPVSQSTDDTEGNSCEDGAGPLGWITCKVLELAGNTLDLLDKMIEGMLNVDKNYVNNDATIEVWKRFRNLAYIILLPLFLVMVISTALGFDFISAYTVKKALPRLIIATLFIALSFEITRFMIIAINNIGGGMLGLMSNAPGITEINNLEDLFAPDWTSSGGLAVLLGMGGGWGTAAVINAGVLAATMGAVWSLIGFLGVAAIMIFLVLLLLAFRQMLIVALAIIAPLAILAWIFPGNDKLWKLWKDGFIKLLLLYPVIMLTLGAGRLFAGIIAASEASGAPENLLNTILKLCAYVLPYALIPFLFKTAGGLFANLSGMVNNRQRGALDRIKNSTKSRGEAWRAPGKKAIADRRAAGIASRLGTSSQLMRGRRIDSGDATGLEYQAEQYKFRKETADLQLEKLRIDAADVSLKQSLQTEISRQMKTGDVHGNPVDTDTARKNALEILNAKLQNSMSNGTATDHEVIAAVKMFGQQKSYSDVASLQDHIAGLGGVQGQKAGESWTKAMANDEAYSAVTRIAPAISSVGVGGATIKDPTLMAQQRAKSMAEGQSLEKLSTASKAAWEELASDATYGHLAAAKAAEIKALGGAPAASLQWP